MNDKKKLVVILNGISRKKKKFYQQILPGLSAKYSVEVLETNYRDHAIELGKETATQNPIGILAAGGDGTLHQVLNGVMQSENPELPPLGIIPLGSGNDFANMASVKLTIESILEKIALGGKPTDVGKMNCLNELGERTTKYFMNAASLGMGPAVVKRLYASNKSLGPELTYFKATVETFFTHKPEAIEIQADHWTWNGKIRSFVMANGQSFGSGLFIAPEAKPDDAEFSTFLVKEIPLLNFVMCLQKIKSKKKLINPAISYDVATKLTLTAPNPCWIETDGELAGLLPAQVEIVPNGIRFFR